MTAQEALSIVDPDTTEETLKHIPSDFRGDAVRMACKIAAECIRQYSILHADDIYTDGTLGVVTNKWLLKAAKKIRLTDGKNSKTYTLEG